MKNLLNAIQVKATKLVNTIEENPQLVLGAVGYVSTLVGTVYLSNKIKNSNYSKPVKMVLSAGLTVLTVKSFEQDIQNIEAGLMLEPSKED